jgi:hypothetical protein
VASGLDPEFVHPALRAPKSLRPPALSQIFKACLLIRKAFAKFPERPWKSWPDHAPKIPETPTGVKWISINLNFNINQEGVAKDRNPLFLICVA